MSVPAFPHTEGATGPLTFLFTKTNKGVCEKKVMDSDSESFHSRIEFYYPEELDVENNGVTRNNENFEDKIKTFIEQQRRANTTKKTTYDLNVWKRFCESIQENRNPENRSVHELNFLLCRFFMAITKKDGSV